MVVRLATRFRHAKRSNRHAGGTCGCQTTFAKMLESMSSPGLFFATAALTPSKIVFTIYWNENGSSNIERKKRWENLHGAREKRGKGNASTWTRTAEQTLLPIAISRVYKLSAQRPFWGSFQLTDWSTEFISWIDFSMRTSRCSRSLMADKLDPPSIRSKPASRWLSCLVTAFWMPVISSFTISCHQTQHASVCHWWPQGRRPRNTRWVIIIE